MRIPAKTASLAKGLGIGIAALWLPFGACAAELEIAIRPRSEAGGLNVRSPHCPGDVFDFRTCEGVGTLSRAAKRATPAAELARTSIKALAPMATARRDHRSMLRGLTGTTGSRADRTAAPLDYTAAGFRRARRDCAVTRFRGRVAASC